MPVVKLAEQASKFGEFYVPRFEVHAAGAAVPEAIIRDVMQVTYKDSIKDIDSFELTVGNWDSTARRLKYIDAETKKSQPPNSPPPLRYKIFEPCAREFELRLGYGSTLTSMTKGIVTTLEPNFPAGGPPTLTIRVLNALDRLRVKQRSNYWRNMRDSEIAKSIKTLTDVVTQRKLEVRVSDAALRRETPLHYVAQDNQYDIDFLLTRARNAGYVVFIDSEEKPKGQVETFVYFGPSDERRPRSDVTYELEWGISLIDFKPVLSMAKQVKSVEVRSWDSENHNKPIRVKVDLTHPGIKVNRDLLPLLMQPGCHEEVVANEPQPTPRQAERRALAILSDRLKEMVTAQGTTVGLPDLRAGQRVQIKGAGSRFSGIYFVTETTHTIAEQGYTTRFTARREQPLPAGAKQ